MRNVYALDENLRPCPMSRIHAKSELQELHRLLEMDPNLLPGDQIDPDDPRRWLLIKREMPVPDPTSGGNRWSIDFFFVDQSATPTFVECKRFEDTRSRREVVGQVLEYAANAPYYWTTDLIRSYAEQTCRDNGSSFEEAFSNLAPDEDMTPEQFFEVLSTNLREGHVRLVFFLEEAPTELKTIVEFLNDQTERSEILLVEARRFSNRSLTVIVPSLFGYTERAHRIKRTVVVPSPGRRRWDETSFFQALEGLSPSEVQSIKRLYEYGISHPYQIGWGTGANRGSFSLKHPPICPRSILTVYSDGTLTFHFLWLDGSEEAEGLREDLRREASSRLGLQVAEGKHSKEFGLAKWGPKVDDLTALLDELVSKWTPEPG